MLSYFFSGELRLLYNNTIKLESGNFCRFCKQISIETLIDFGPQPRCFDFLTNKEKTPKLFEFSAGQCRRCGIIQLKNQIPAKDLLPSFDWIRNKEPDKHADLLANDLLEYLKNDNSKVLFISVYDKKLYGLINKHTGEKAYLLDPIKDLEIEEFDPGQALIQKKINPEKLKKLRKKIGKFDLIVTCRLLEHAHDANEFISGLSQLLKPNGRLVVEVPDSTKPLLQGDVAMFWEEHTFYFTPESLICGFSEIGFKLEKYIGYHYLQEDAIVAIFQQKKSTETLNVSMPVGELSLGKMFVKKIESLKSEIIAELSELKQKCGKIVIFGAGHRTVMFLNLLNLKNLVSYVIDDDQRKQGLIIPKSGLEIHKSDLIRDENIGVCLLSVNIEIEEKLKDIINAKIRRKIKYFSISPDSKNALPSLNIL